MNGILIVDDDLDFIETFNKRAVKNGFILYEANSLEQLKIKIKEIEHKIGAIILDIKCMITDDQIEEDRSFLPNAISFLDTQNILVPRVVLTGDKDEFENLDSLFSEEDFYLKEPDGFKELFIVLRKHCNNSANIKIKKMYPEIFEIFELGLMKIEQEKQLLNILKRIDEKDELEFKGILSNVRSILEAIYKEINMKNKTIIPDSMFEANGKIIWNKLMKHLIGRTSETNCVKLRIPIDGSYKNQTIFNFSESLYWSCGQYIHNDPNRTYMISHYALKSLIYNLMELLMWSKKYLK